MKTNTLVKVFFLFSVSVISFRASGQLTVNNSVTAQQLVQNLIGTGISVSNITYTGAAVARGTFNGSSSNVGIPSGVLLTTGHVSYAPGPNLSDSDGDDNLLNGDATMDILAGQQTYDATILAFDFIPTTDTIRFRYVFGSEEYPEFVYFGYNDVFGFFLSGPGISGPYPGNAINIALVPSTAIPVAIDNVNNGYAFQCTTSLPGPCVNCAYYVNNCSGTTVGYDGFTTVLTAMAVIQKCNTYHIRIAIADAGDGIYDSGVFLEEGSFTSGNLSAAASIVGASSGCAPLPVNFLNQSAGADTYLWNFGDGSPTDTSANPNHTYTAPGVYNVTLIASSTVGCYSDTTYLTVTVNQGGAVASFNLVQNATCDSLTINATSNGSGGHLFNWDFGDGNNATGTNVNHSYTIAGNYTITLIVTDTICNSADTAVSTVTFTPSGITAAFNLSQNSTCDTLFISANNNSSGGHFFDWNFGDGNTASGTNVNHFYTQGGTYIVTLTVTDTVCNATDTATVTVVFNPNIPATINIPAASGCVPFSVNFCADTSSGSSYLWDFGDGNSSTLACASNTYSLPGVYNVTLIVSNPVCNWADTATATVTVYSPPVSDFAITDTFQSVNVPVLFTDLSTGATSYYWTFGDGGSDTQQNTEHLYQAAATWTICLVATSAGGCTDTLCKPVTLFEEPAEIFVPNAFTPNRDRANQFFFPLGVGILDYTMEIYDRWGERLFVSNESRNGWDGTYQGRELPMGIYVYIIRANLRNDIHKELTGSIALIR